jgi:hypothetical protein
MDAYFTPTFGLAGKITRAAKKQPPNVDGHPNKIQPFRFRAERFPGPGAGLSKRVKNRKELPFSKPVYLLKKKFSIRLSMARVVFASKQTEYTNLSTVWLHNCFGNVFLQ